MRRKRGFTLIELMIVIAIIAILAAVLVPNFMRVRRSAQMNACLSNVKNIGTAVESFSVDSGGTYPDPQNDMVNLAHNYVGKPMYCPTKNNFYVYTIENDGVTYLVSCPEDGASGANSQQPNIANGFAQNGIQIADTATITNNLVGNWGTIYDDGSLGGNAWPIPGERSGSHQAAIRVGGATQNFDPVYPAVHARFGAGLLF